MHTVCPFYLLQLIRNFPIGFTHFNFLINFFFFEFAAEYKISLLLCMLFDPSITNLVRKFLMNCNKYVLLAKLFFIFQRLLNHIYKN